MAEREAPPGVVCVEDTLEALHKQTPPLGR